MSSNFIEKDSLTPNLFFGSQEDDARSSGTSSPESTGSVESSISSHFGGVSYPSLFSSRPTSYGASQTSVGVMPLFYLVSVSFLFFLSW